MGQTNRRTFARPALAVLMAVPLAVFLAPQPAIGADAPDNTAEREVLAAVTRQLELLDRLTERAAAVSPRERARYRFDHARLRADLLRIHAGVQDYLVPQRAQPRDPVPLAGDYTLSGVEKDQEMPSP